MKWSPGSLPLRWRELDPRGQAVLLTLLSVQISLTATAWADLASRPAEEINGSKRRWAVIAAVGYLGPALYFARGHRR